MNATGDVVPAKAAIPVTDLMTGMYAHGAILAALYRGVGDKIDCDLLSTQLAMMINLGSNYLNAGNIFFFGYNFNYNSYTRKWMFKIGT